MNNEHAAIRIRNTEIRNYLPGNRMAAIGEHSAHNRCAESGSRKHAARRVHEVEDASALLRELGVEPRVSEAAGGWLREVRDRG